MLLQAMLLVALEFQYCRCICGGFVVAAGCLVRCLLVDCCELHFLNDTIRNIRHTHTHIYALEHMALHKCVHSLTLGELAEILKITKILV